MSNRKPLGHFLDAGVAVIPTRDDGPTLGSWKDRGNFITDRDTLARYWRQGYRRYQFHPAYHGLLCLDIDRKGGKDGLRALRKVFLDAGLVLPGYLEDVETFPARTVSPSGGLHLHFRYRGTRRYRSGEIAPGLEAVHYNHLLTAPGSQKDGRPYVFYGSLDDAPEAPPVLLRLLTVFDTEKKIYPRPWTYDRHEGPLSLDDIAGIIERQGEHSPESSRNRYVYELAKFAKRKDRPAGEVEAWARARFEAPDFDAREIAAAIESAYGRTN